MKAKDLYARLEKEFIKPSLSDDWAQYMGSVSDLLSENFKERSMGLVCDFAMEIDRVYTAVFPSRNVMQKILDDGTQNTMLFVHHPSIWDIRKDPEVFQQMDRKLLQQFKDRRISIYNLHVPLDNFGEHSTSVTLARALGLRPKKPFASYFGGLSGVLCETDFATVQDLRRKFQEAVGHEVSLYRYGDENIQGKTIAVVAGGGLGEAIDEVAQNKASVFLTGITAKNDHSKKAHDVAEKHKISILGGTHYSTEKFACISMIGYFKKIGLNAEFVEDKPVMEDL